MFVFGLASSFFLISSADPSKVTMPIVEYLTMFGLVVISKLKLRSTWSMLFFCSSSLAFTSKKSFSVGRYCPVLSA